MDKAGCIRKSGKHPDIYRQGSGFKFQKVMTPLSQLVEQLTIKLNSINFTAIHFPIDLQKK